MTAEQLEQRTGLSGITLSGNPPQIIAATGDAQVIERVNAWLARHGLSDDIPSPAEIAADQQLEEAAKLAIAALQDAIAAGAPTTVAQAGQRILRLERMMLFVVQRVLRR